MASLLRLKQRILFPSLMAAVCNQPSYYKCAMKVCGHFCTQEMPAFDAAEMYDRNSMEQREDGLKLIQLLAPQRGRHVLDLGCGTGYLSKVLADLVGPEGQVVAIDPDVERLKIARDKQNADNIRYLEGSSENLPGGEEEFDIVFSNYVMHWIKDKAELFRDVAEVLKKGGRFGFVVPSSFDIVKVMLTPSEMFSPECRDIIIKNSHPMSVKEYEEIFSSNNFEIVYLKESISKWRYSGVDELHTFNMSTLTHGQFDETHFNVEAMRRYYGDGEIIKNFPLLEAIVRKM